MVCRYLTAYSHGSRVVPYYVSKALSRVHDFAKGFAVLFMFFDMSGPESGIRKQTPGQAKVRIMHGLPLIHRTGNELVDDANECGDF